jgi:hypothetical protein
MKERGYDANFLGKLLPLAIVHQMLASRRRSTTSDEPEWQASDDPPSFDFRRDKGLRRASNEGTLRAFRNADRFPTFKIFRRPGAL